MKHLVMICLMAILVSCRTESAELTDKDKTLLHINLKGSDVNSRAFFDPSIDAESWESEIQRLTVWICNDTEIIIRKDLSDEEIDRMSVTLEVPVYQAQGILRVFAVANYEVQINTPGELAELIEQNISRYNGNFNSVSNSSLLPDGFVMSGNVEIGNISANQIQVTLVLKRTVAKVAIRTVIDPKFQQRYPDYTVRIDQLTVSDHSDITPLFPQNPYIYNKGEELLQFSFFDGERFNNLFYLFENDIPKGADFTPTITLIGWMIIKQSEAFRIPIRITKQLNFSGNGKISRNTYYRVELHVAGLGENDVRVSFEVAPWYDGGLHEIEYGNN